MMFPFLNSLIGFFIAYRIIVRKKGENIFVNIYELHFLILSAISLLTLQLLFADKMLSWILIGIFLISLSLFLKFSDFFHEEMLLKQFPLLLSEIMIELSMGLSLRKAIQSVFERQSEQSIVARFLFSKVKKYFFLREIEVENKNSMLEQGFFEELIEIESSQNKIHEKIFNLRNHYQRAIKFRHRSRQILMQPRLQALLISIMYCCFLFMSGSFHKIVELKVIYGASLFLYGTGIYWLANLGRWKKWKV